jgi:hypothetical protein
MNWTSSKFKTIKPSVVANVHNPSIYSGGRGQKNHEFETSPGKVSKTLPQKQRAKIKGLGCGSSDSLKLWVQSPVPPAPKKGCAI